MHGAIQQVASADEPVRNDSTMIWLGGARPCLPLLGDFSHQNSNINAYKCSETLTVKTMASQNLASSARVMAAAASEVFSVAELSLLQLSDASDWKSSNVHMSCPLLVVDGRHLTTTCGVGRDQLPQDRPICSHKVGAEGKALVWSLTTSYIKQHIV